MTSRIKKGWTVPLGWPDDLRSEGSNEGQGGGEGVRGGVVGRYNRSPLISFRRLDAGSSSIAVRVAI